MNGYPCENCQRSRKRRNLSSKHETVETFSRPHNSLLLQSKLLFDSMKCPFCGFENDKVVDSRESKEADSIRRRRECLKCEKRFTTYERIDEIPYMVVKKDGRRERFDRQKVLNGLMRACEKRPVPISKLEQIVNEAEGFVIDSPERERKTSEIGELIMNRLRRHDKVAYVRFASVYLDFKDVQEFMTELKDLLKTKDGAEPRAKVPAKN
jgi:transcriptional repressor NrdR